MKKHFFLFFLVFFSIELIAQPEYTIIAFYNLENLFDTFDDSTKNDEEFTPNGSYAYTETIFNKKLKNLEQVISQLGTEKNVDGPAILGVAEIENRYVLEKLIEQPKIKNRNYKIVHFEGPDERGIDCALLYNPKYFKVSEAKAITLTLAEFDDLRPTRDILYVTGKLLDEPIHLFVNHWPSRRGGESATAPKRNKGAATCKKIIDSIVQLDPHAKVILMGDLNDDPINESVTKYLNAKENIEDVKKGGLYNPWVKFYRQGIGTIAWQDSWGLFDQIIISQGWLNKKTKGLHFQEAEVFNRSFLIEKFGRYKGYPKRTFSWGKWNNGYSDHFPTIIYLRK